VLPGETLGQPVPLTPHAVAFTNLPTLSWTAVNGATHYFLVVTDITTGQVVFMGAVPSNSWTPPMPLSVLNIYTWFVQARDDHGNFGPDSKQADFLVG
jgi:hypothetical protein